jgi:periplasmic copper chaperone A
MCGDLNSMCHTVRLTPLVVAAATLTLAASACGSGSDSQNATTAPEASALAASDSISISGAWSRQPAVGQSVSAVYGVVTNNTDAEITLSAASTSVTDRVELHETLTQDDGTMSMREVDAGFSVPAGRSFTFEPGGPHIMLLDVDSASYPTDDVDVTLITDTGEQTSFVAEVRSLNAADDEMGDMTPGTDSVSEQDG